MKAGDHVQVFDLEKAEWRDAVLIKARPYRTRHGSIDGFDFLWYPRPTDKYIMPSQGGWAATKYIRKEV